MIRVSLNFMLISCLDLNFSTLKGKLGFVFFFFCRGC